MSLEPQRSQSNGILPTDNSLESPPSSWPVELRSRAIEEFENDDQYAKPPTTSNEEIHLDLQLANKFAKEGRLVEAEKIYRAVFRCTCLRNFDFYLDWAEVLLELGQDAEASEIYELALGAIDVESGRLFELYKNIGNLAVKQGDFEQAEEFYNKAYTIDSKSAGLMVNYGTLAIQKNNHEEAFSYFQHATELEVENDRAWTGLALIHYSKSDMELAWACVLRGLDANPSNRTALGLLIQWGMEENLSIVVQRIIKYLSIEHSDGDMSLLLSRLLVAQGNLRLARIEVERAYQLLEEPSEAFKLRNQLTRQLKDEK